MDRMEKIEIASASIFNIPKFLQSYLFLQKSGRAQSEYAPPERLTREKGGQGPDGGALRQPR